MKGKNQGGGCKCEGCGARFSGLTAFDMHRAGDYAKRNHTRHCLSAKDMRAKGMMVGNRGTWTTGEFDDERRAS